MHFRSGLLLLAVLSLFGCGGNGDDGPIKTGGGNGGGSVTTSTTQFFLAVTSPSAETRARSRASSARAATDTPATNLTIDNFSAEVLIPDSSQVETHIRRTPATVVTYEDLGSGLYRLDIDGTARIDTIIYVTVDGVRYQVLAIKAGSRAEPVPINLYTTVAVNRFLDQIANGDINLESTTTDTVTQSIDDIVTYLQTINIPTGSSADDILTLLNNKSSEGCNFVSGCSSALPDHLTEAYLKGKTFYIAEYVESSIDAQQQTIPAHTAVYQAAFGTDGKLVHTGILDPAEADFTVDFHVNAAGYLYGGTDSSSGNRISCGSTSDYLQIDYEENGLDLRTSRFYFTQAKALEFANTNLGTPIPRCVPETFSYEYLAGRKLYQIYIDSETRSQTLVEQVTLNLDGTGSNLSGINTTGTGTPFTWYVDQYGTLVADADAPTAPFNGEEGYRVTCGSTETYFKTNHMFNNHDIVINSLTDVTFFAFDSTTASVLGDSLTTSSSIYQACSIDTPPVNLVGSWRSDRSPNDNFTIFVSDKLYFSFEGSPDTGCTNNGFEFGYYGWSRGTSKTSFTPIINGQGDCGPNEAQPATIELPTDNTLLGVSNSATSNGSTYNATRVLPDSNTTYIGSWGASGTDSKSGPYAYALTFLADGNYVFLSHNVDDPSCPPGDSYEFGTYSIDPQTLVLSVAPTVLHGVGCTIASQTSAALLPTPLEILVEGDSLQLYNPQDQTDGGIFKRLK